MEIFASPVSPTPAANFGTATGVVDTGGKFHLNRVGDGNDDISSEERFKNLKTIRGSYFLLEHVSSDNHTTLHVKTMFL